MMTGSKASAGSWRIRGAGRLRRHDPGIHGQAVWRRKDMSQEKVIVLDFGGQYNQLIARRVRECNVYCEVHPYNLSLDKIREMDPKGIIFTGGPNSVYGEDSPVCPK